MGNSQAPVAPLLVSRPYDAACKSIAQTTPVTTITSYQHPAEAHAEDEHVSVVPKPVHGCCLSPAARRDNTGIRPVAYKTESFWDYGDADGLAYNDCREAAAGDSSRSELAAVTTTTADDNNDDKSATAAANKVNSKAEQQTAIAKLVKSIESRSQVKLPVYGSVNNHKPFLEPQILDHLLPFIFDSTLGKCFSVCPHWLRTIYGHLRRQSEPILESFQREYCQDGHLMYESSSINIQPIFTAEAAAVRIDLLIYCKVLPACQNQCTQIGYSFSYATSPPSVTTTCSPEPPTPSRHRQSTPHSVGSDSDSSSRGSKSSSKQAAAEDPLASTRLLPEPTPRPPSTILPPTSCSYSVNPAHAEYQAQFRFETIRKGLKRQLWIQRDMCRFHGDELMVGSMSNVPVICVDDRIEVPVNIANAFGLVNLNSIRWAPLEFVSGSGRMFGQRCELERRNQIWVGLDQFQPTTNERLQNNDHFGSQWKHLKTEFTGIDVVLSRSEYTAVEIGEIPNAKRWLGLEACVRPANYPIVCALPRLGLQHDRFSMKQFRQGDTIRLYVSQGGGIIQ